MENEILVIKNILQSLEGKLDHDNFMHMVLKNVENWTDGCDNFENIIEKIQTVIRKIHADVCTILDNENDSLKESLNCSLEKLTLYILHADLSCIIHNYFQKEDKFFYSKCKNLCAQNVTAEQLGAPGDFALPFSAAVTEFSNIDNCKTPASKLNCLCATLDLIYAELKYAFIEVFSILCSEDNTNIPVIEKKDVFPIILFVVIRSQPLHLKSNIYYIEHFFYGLEKFSQEWKIFLTFKEAAAELNNISTLKPPHKKVFRGMDLQEVIKVTQKETFERSKQTMNTPSVLDIHNRRILKLIMLSTSYKHS